MILAVYLFYKIVAARKLVKYSNPSLTPRSPKGDVSHKQCVGLSPSGDLRGVVWEL
jgi:hypothetical protein